MGSLSSRSVLSVSRRCLIALAGAAVALPAPAETAAQKVGLVEDLRGSAFARRDKVRRLEIRSEILLNDEVWTEPESRATLALSGGSFLHLGPSARLTIDKYIAEADGDITLGTGGLIFDRPEDSPKTDLTVQTVFGLIGVRGTQFFAGPSQGVFGLFVARGRVRFYAAGVGVELTAGEGVDVAVPGAPPSPVVRWNQRRIDAAFASIIG